MQDDNNQTQPQNLDNQNIGQIEPIIQPEIPYQEIVQPPVIQEPAVAATVPLSNKINKISIAFLVMLILTFFTPLGAVLFLPMIVCGFVLAGKVFENDSKNSVVTGHKNPLVQLLKLIIMIVSTIVLLIIGFIALIFIGFATGAIELDLGS